MNESTPVVSDVKSEIQTLVVCKNCNHEFSGKYCNQCGEKVIHQQDRSIKHFLGEVFHAFTHADGKIIRNLKVILLNPGFLSKQYSEGIRKPYLNLVSMFFVGNLIYFLFPITIFKSSLRDQTSQPYKAIVNQIVERRIEGKMNEKAKEKTTVNIEENEQERIKARQIAYQTLREKYDIKTSSLSKLVLILLVPIFAVPLYLLHVRRKPYFADHLLLSLEFMCFSLFYAVVFSALIFVVFGSILSYLSVNVNGAKELFEWSVPLLML
jgi:hypothetical protein